MPCIILCLFFSDDMGFITRGIRQMTWDCVSFNVCFPNPMSSEYIPIDQTDLISVRSWFVCFYIACCANSLATSSSFRTWSLVEDEHSAFSGSLMSKTHVGNGRKMQQTGQWHVGEWHLPRTSVQWGPWGILACQNHSNPMISMQIGCMSLPEFHSYKFQASTSQFLVGTKWWHANKA